MSRQPPQRRIPHPHAPVIATQEYHSGISIKHGDEEEKEEDDEVPVMERMELSPLEEGASDDDIQPSFGNGDGATTTASSTLEGVSLSSTFPRLNLSVQTNDAEDVFVVSPKNIPEEEQEEVFVVSPRMDDDDGNHSANDTLYKDEDIINVSGDGDEQESDLRDCSPPSSPILLKANRRRLPCLLFHRPTPFKDESCDLE